MYQQESTCIKILRQRILRMPLPPDSDLLVDELKRIQLQCSAWLNNLKATLPSFNVEFYGWKVKGDYDLVPKWVRGKQLPPSNASSNETN